MFARLIDRQLKERVSQVFLLDRGTMTAFAVGEADPALPPGEVVAQFGDWFRTVDGPRISPFKLHERAGGYNVVAVPAPRDARLMLVATVPVVAMENQLLDRLGRGETVATLLVDDAGVVMAGKEASWVGRDLNSLGGPLAGQTMHELRLVNYRDTRVMAEPFKVGDGVLPPSMFATEPVEVAGRTWFLLIASHLEEVDAAVTGLVRNGLPWVIFVVLAMTGLLASTSVQLIRNRVRLERERTRALEADIANARQIQLAWLPEGGAVYDGLDVAAINLPAAHVSGDFYNWFALPNGRAAVVIGDVTGHGMSAAFLMATVQLMVRNTLPIVGDPGRCLEEVNNQLCVQMFHGQFVTIQVLVIDPANNRLELANAGHPPPLTCDGDAERVQPAESGAAARAGDPAGRAVSDGAVRHRAVLRDPALHGRRARRGGGGRDAVRRRSPRGERQRRALRVGGGADGDGRRCAQRVSRGAGTRRRPDAGRDSAPARGGR